MTNVIILIMIGMYIYLTNGLIKDKREIEDWSVSKNKTGYHITKVDTTEMQSVIIEDNGAIMLGFMCLTEGTKPVDIRMNTEMGNLRYELQPVKDQKTTRINDYGDIDILAGFVYFKAEKEITRALTKICMESKTLRIIVEQPGEAMISEKLNIRNFSKAYKKITQEVSNDKIKQAKINRI